MTHATDIAGYTWWGENLHPACMIENLISAGMASPGARGMDPEDVLHQLLASGEFSDCPPGTVPEDYPTELDTYDSNYFPKPFFDSDVSGWETCARCNDPL